MIDHTLVLGKMSEIINWLGDKTKCKTKCALALAPRHAPAYLSRART